MKAIYKYQLKNISQQIIKMPEGAEILSLQTQFGVPCIWAKVDTDGKTVDRNFVLIGTGHPLPESPITFIGTYQKHEFVFHVFELI